MTLRDECEAFVREHRFGLSASLLSIEPQVKALMAFARSQQAVGLREAAQTYRQRGGGDIGFETWCEQRAREREGV